MYLLMADKANKLLYKYRVQEFPIPLDTIEYIIHSEDIDIQITKCLNRALFCNNVIYISPNLERSYLREYLVHEAGHMYHAGNTAFLDPIVVDKNEGQARAFAAYFLMPIGIFELYLARGENDHSLGEIFGVKQELVRIRKILSHSLIESGNYDRFKYRYVAKIAAASR
jgi:Zn-dependent peptidase ImmA (M78 family)